MEFHILSILEILVLSYAVSAVTGKKTTCEQEFTDSQNQFYEGQQYSLLAYDKVGIAHGNKVWNKCRYMAKHGLAQQCLKKACKGFPPPQKDGIVTECYDNTSACDDNTKKYRTFDGSCNNEQNVTWGMANRIYNRVLDNAYDDGKDKPREKSVCRGGELPSARKVSNIVHDSMSPPLVDEERSVFITFFGQFLAHDIALTPISTDEIGDPLDCCGKDKQRPECFKIKLKPNDPDFRKRKCMNFVRSVSRLDCNGIRQQVNEQTAFLDLSQVYGVSKEENLNLRTGNGGELKVEPNDKLPVDISDSLCERAATCTLPECYCPIAGDPRVGEIPALSAMHTLFHRNHNFLARGVSRENPSYNDEQTFSVARKINIAMWQNVIYKEYLPATIGTSVMQQYNIDVKDSVRKNTYNQATDATLFNGFPTAVLRFGHSIVPNSLVLRDYDFNLISQEKLENHFFKPELYHSSNGKGLEHTLMGTITTGCPLRDRKVEDSVRVHLFQDQDNISFDLASLNIQRCTDDIDAWTGMISENNAPGSQLGPTSQCLVAKQFKWLRDGDRFFYENTGPAEFNTGQLAEIKKVRMSTLLCLNTGATEIQENVFFTSDSSTNMKIKCEDVNGTDFSKWLDGDGN